MPYETEHPTRVRTLEAIDCARQTSMRTTTEPSRLSVLTDSRR